jgi:hypothetical protein
MQDDRIRTLFTQLIATPAATLQAYSSLKSSLLSDPGLLTLTIDHLSNPDDTPAQQR